ncbi:MAG: HDIG domain-containing protein, partial [Chloroflexi bacterium]|nr:HDIG domain-containing protein [Chloroflexota bacterium]
SGVMFSLALGLLAAYGLPTTLDLSLYYIISSLCGILAMGNARRATGFLRAGLVSSLAGMGILAAFHWPHYEMDWLGMATLAGASVFNGLASASLALLAQFFLANWLGLTTALQLHEISRPDFPLLQYFLRRAPGTYQHSLQAVNLAEQAAEKIGADALLTRVGGLFHDIGKAANPAFFIENQTPGNLDTHDDMDPGEAARTIIRHVADGLELAQKHHLPHRIRDFITEHHGTLVTRYQFNRAAEQSGKNKTKLNVDDFRYPGPEPRSRETAILMLADGVEARVRAERPKDEEGLAAIVRSVIERCQKESQFDHTSLTQNDLRLISESFVASLRGTFHPRLEYPKDQLDFPTTPLKRGK